MWKLTAAHSSGRKLKGGQEGRESAQIDYGRVKSSFALHFFALFVGDLLCLVVTVDYRQQNGQPAVLSLL